MYCEKCGAVLPQNAKFCGACGSMVLPQEDNATVLMSAPAAEDKETVLMAPAAADNATVLMTAPPPAPIKQAQAKPKKKRGAAGLVIVGVVMVAAALAVMGYFMSRSDNGSIEAAQGFYSRGEYAQAIQEYDKLLVSDKTSPEIYLGKAQALIAMGDKAAAKEVLNEGFRRTGSDEIWQMIQSMEE
ncbi:MAG: tetratricopeptide repeat protein [Oscillospiraceae bacterium]